MVMAHDKTIYETFDEKEEQYREAKATKNR